MNAKSAGKQIEIDSSINIFRSVYMKKKTLENIQIYSGFVLTLYFMALFFFNYFDVNFYDLLKGIVFILLVISALANTVVKFYLQRHWPYRIGITWQWNIFLMILFGYGIYNPTYELPNAWAGPVGTFIVGIVLVLDMRRINRKHEAARKAKNREITDGTQSLSDNVN